MKGVFYCCAFKANWAVVGKNSSIVEGCYCVGYLSEHLKSITDVSNRVEHCI